MAMAVLAIHPGEHLAEELQTIGMSAAELARNLGVPTNRVTQILKGQRAITGDTALRLAHFFGTSPEFWLNLQSIYDLRIAQQKFGRAIDELPTLKQSARRPSKRFDLRKALKSITKKNLHPETDFGRAQGKELLGGVRRTR
jgi:antitoxin HigA-1